jgi:two-component system response regulator PilR (NtrC family)
VRLETLLDDYERSLLSESLRLSGGVKKDAAKLLGVSFRSFRYRLEKLEMDGINWRTVRSDFLRV